VVLVPHGVPSVCLQSGLTKAWEPVLRL